MDTYLGQLYEPHFPSGVALTIGNFDGVHLGHLKILQCLKAQAKAMNLASVLMIFEPSSAEYFARKYQKTMPYRLSPLRDKLSLLQKTDCLDAVWVARFGHAFSCMSAEEFIKTILIETLNVRYLLVGDDFRFGVDRQGDFELLSQYKEFTTERLPSIRVASERASSTAVREALVKGQLDQAARILGHEYSLSGRVMHGQQLGRQLGCPTANIYLPPHHYPLSGVFVVDVMGAFGLKKGVASFGLNPTVTNTQRKKLEVHIFDHKEDVYGQKLTVYFKHKLRDEMKFDSIEALQAQIFEDMDLARQWQ